jgi:hypothetical protein
MCPGTIKRMQTLISADGRTHRTCEVDEHGKQIGPTRVVTADPVTIANGLAATTERVSRFVTSATRRSCLHIFALDHTRGFSLSGFTGPMIISMPRSAFNEHPEWERVIRELFSRHGIALLRDAHGREEAFLKYPLPESAEGAADLCLEVLASGYGIADDEALVFTVMQYP